MVYRVINNFLFYSAIQAIWMPPIACSLALGAMHWQEIVLSPQKNIPAIKVLLSQS